MHWQTKFTVAVAMIGVLFSAAISNAAETAIPGMEAAKVTESLKEKGFTFTKPKKAGSKTTWIGSKKAAGATFEATVVSGDGKDVESITLASKLPSEQVAAGEFAPLLDTVAETAYEGSRPEVAKRWMLFNADQTNEAIIGSARFAMDTKGFNRTLTVGPKPSGVPEGKRLVPLPSFKAGPLTDALQQSAFAVEEPGPSDEYKRWVCHVQQNECLLVVTLSGKAVDSIDTIEAEAMVYDAADADEFAITVIEAVAGMVRYVKAEPKKAKAWVQENKGTQESTEIGGVTYQLGGKGSTRNLLIYKAE